MDLAKLWFTGIAIFIIIMTGAGMASEPAAGAAASSPGIAAGSR